MNDTVKINGEPVEPGVIDRAGLPQPGGLVRFTMIGKDLSVDLAFAGDEQFNPTNPGHLLAWYCQDQAGHLLPLAYKLYNERVQVVKRAVETDEMLASGNEQGSPAATNDGATPEGTS